MVVNWYAALIFWLVVMIYVTSGPPKKHKAKEKKMNVIVNLEKNPSMDAYVFTLDVPSKLQMPISPQLLHDYGGNPEELANYIATQLTGFIKSEVTAQVYSALLKIGVGQNASPDNYYKHLFDPYPEIQHKVYKSNTSSSGNAAVNYYSSSKYVDEYVASFQPEGEHAVVKELKKVCEGLDEMVQCPEEGCTTSAKLHQMIPHLNDSSHNWKREKIADWLESLDVNININTPGDIDINNKEDNNEH